MPDGEHDSSAARSIVDLLGRFRRGSKWLFDQKVRATTDQLERCLNVCVGGRCDDGEIDVWQSVE